jgi:membrane protease YdiL (CAAX protease family)
MRFVARRATPEIARRGAGREALLGGLLGLGFIVVSAVLIAGFGGYSFSWSHDGVVAAVASAVVAATGAAVTEELMFRGAALQALEQRWGSWVALAVTALFFGAAHLSVAGADAWSGVAIALEAGVLLGAAFLWRRNMWFVVGLHGAWNAAEQLLGVPVSGHDGGKSLLVAKVSGSEWLVGGAFGLEASVVPVVISVLISVPMLVAARRRGGLRAARRAGRAA